MSKKKHCFVGIHKRRPKSNVATKIRKASARARKQAFFSAQAERIALARAAL